MGACSTGEEGYAKPTWRWLPWTMRGGFAVAEIGSSGVALLRTQAGIGSALARAEVWGC